MFCRRAWLCWIHQKLHGRFPKESLLVPRYARMSVCWAATQPVSPGSQEFQTPQKTASSLTNLELLDQKIHPLLLQELITISVVLVFLMIIFKDIRAGNSKELKATVQLESYSLITRGEYELHDWRAAINGYELFRRDRQWRGSRFTKK